MHRLMRAEWFRLRKADNVKRTLFYFIICVVLATVLPLFFGEENTFEKAYGAFAEMAAVQIPVFWPVVAAILTGLAFNGRQAYHEVMIGVSLWKRITSRIVVDCGLVVLLFCLVMGGFLGGIALFLPGQVVDGFGLRLLALLILALRLTVMGGMFGILARGAIGAGFAYLKMCAEALAVLILQEGFSLMDAGKVLSVVQVEVILTGEMTGTFVCTVVVSALVEMTFWTLITYFTGKRTY